jgi:transcription initiation factor TFIID subunit 12
MSNPAPQGAMGAAPAAQQSAGLQLLKADDIPKLQCLSDDMKQKYRPVVHNLWSIMQTKPAGSMEHNQARQKLQDWSSKLIAQERAHRTRLKASQQNPGQPSQQNQSQPSEQASQPTNDQQPTQPQLQSQSQQQQQQQQQPQPPMQQTTNAVQGQRPPQANPQTQIDPEIVKHVQGFKYWLPAGGPQEGTPEGDAKIKEMRNSYLMALNKQHRATQRIKALSSLAEQRQKSGQEISAEMLGQKSALEKEYAVAKEYVESFRKKQSQNKSEQDQRRAQQQAQGLPAQQQQQRQPSQPNIKEEPQIKVEGGPLPQVMAAQPFASVQGGGASTQSQQLPLQNAQAPAPSQAQQAMRQPPAPLSQQHQQQSQHSQFTQPGQSHRPQINPHQASAMQHQANSPHPQSATSNAAGQPIPLTHQAAVTAAQRSYSHLDGPQRTTTPMQQGGSGSFQAPGSREREQLNNPKMPIARNMTVTQPVPVGMGQARPTMSGPTNGAPGPMGQPVINKFPPFQLEGDGDRVLSKRKLDELVRQVTGGSEEALTAEVEEVRATNSYVTYSSLLTRCRQSCSLRTTLSIQSSVMLASSPSSASHRSLTSEISS